MNGQPIVIEKERSGCGCGTVVMGVFAGAVFALIGSGVFLYLKVPEWCDKAIPYLESKGRVLLGKVALASLHNSVSASDLSPNEREKWEEYVDRQWEVAYQTDDTSLSRERIINYGLDVVNSFSGSYYSLAFIHDEIVDESTLGKKTKRRAKKLLSAAREAMEDGLITDSQLLAIKDDIHTVASGWTVTTETNGRKEKSHCLRQICRHLDKIMENKDFRGDGAIQDMPGLFRKQLERFRARVDYAGRTPGDADGQPVADPSTVPDTLIRSVPSVQRNRR